MNPKPFIAMIVVFGLLLGSLGFSPTPSTGAQVMDSGVAEPFRWLAGPDSSLSPSENWMSLPTGGTHWYAFDYQGQLEPGKDADEGKMVWVRSQIHVSLDAEPDRGATFNIWTPEQVRRWGLGEKVEPVGRGTKNEFEPGDLFWSGSFASPGRYYIVVEHRGSAPTWLKLIICSQGVFVPTVRETAQRLRDEGYGAVASGAALGALGLDAPDAGQVLKDVGYPAVEVGQALKDAFGLDAQGAAQVLKDVDFSAGEVGLVLKRVFELDAQSVARILRDVLGLNARGAARILKDIGFPAGEVGLALKDIFGLDVQSAARILMDIGFPMGEIGLALKHAFNLDAQGAAQVLKDIGFPVGEIGLALKHAFNLDGKGAAQVLKDIGFSAGEVGLAMKDAFDLDGQGAAQVLKDVGFSAGEIGLVLRAVFGLTDQGAVQALKDVGFSTVEVGAVLRDAFSLDGPQAAQILEALGFTLNEMFTVLTHLYGLPDVQVEDIFVALGFNDAEFLWVTAREYVEKYAPVLKFDGKASTFPMDAQKWFEDMLCGEQSGPQATTNVLECQKRFIGWGNNFIANLWLGNAEFSTLDEYGHKVPTYYKIGRCGTAGQLRIEYWWFYGWQAGVSLDWDAQDHPADWEHIMITTSEDRQRIAAITYYQHSGWYTRNNGRWYTDTATAHPVVYVGKTAHGSYHDDGGSGTVYYYEDWRNPKSHTFWNTWETPLINLDGDEQDWLNYDRTATWTWGYEGGKSHVYTHPTEYTPDLCNINACQGKKAFATAGCLYGKSDCLIGDCWFGSSTCLTDCGSGVAGKEYYQNDYLIPVSDGGFFGE